MARGGAIGPLPGGFQTAAEMGQTHAQAGTRAGGWAEGVGSNATAVSSLAGALERQLLDVLQQPRAPAAATAAAAAGEGPQQQADPAAQGAGLNQAQPDTAEAQRLDSGLLVESQCDVPALSSLMQAGSFYCVAGVLAVRMAPCTESCSGMYVHIQNE